ncbi:Low-density lipoprotein receptor-related protein 5 [Geodia barretti]|uniref:Low-density lipoprotein receptor-related protein 5 n=1 Tax=Geodia barretti TaxID=519541 RepID=A0AA35SEQ1_GEOBA|nr:Low-density lipoprotein receptor-related protein 5 [Geodia barretti]
MVSGRVFFAFLVVALAVGCNGNHCFSYQFECDSGQCVENDYRCDREDDCYDGSDEDGCSGTCYSYQFECKSGQCVSPSSSECDGTDDCYDGSDEDGCACMLIQHMKYSCSTSNVIFFVCLNGQRT